MMSRIQRGVALGRGVLCVSGLLIAVLAAGCASASREAMPKELVSAAQPVGLGACRDWGDQFSPVLQASAVESIKQTRANNLQGVLDPVSGRINVLAISGGGSFGAYGAGLLCGWTKRGDRPPFKLVTGISTGSLIAPFAFLGPAYDDVLRKCYTEVSTKDIYRERSLFEVLFQQRSLYDTQPLADLIARTIDEKVLAEIAAEHRRGRRLFVGTTNLDAGRLVIWDMGAIASSGNPDSLKIFRKVLRASAAIPAAFPPEMFEVEAGGKAYDELHVDGGAAVQVFFYGFTLDLRQAELDAGPRPESLPKATGPGRLFVIRNGTNRTQWSLVKPHLLPVAMRTVGNLLSYQGLGDLYRIYTIAQRDGLEFHLATIPDDFEFKGKESFDRADMNRMFDLAYGLALKGYPWGRTPPGLVQASRQQSVSSSSVEPGAARGTMTEMR